ATLGDLLASLVEEVPELNGAVISVDGRSLAEGSIASLDGESFTRDSSTVLPHGKPVLLLPAASGG
ncbi:MAG: ubiquitin family protein, partial [Planctomycetota bacterium]